MNTIGASAFHGRGSGQIGQAFKGLNEPGPTVRIPPIVGDMDAYEDIKGLQDLGPCQCQAQENRVSGRDIGNGDSPTRLLTDSL